MDCFQVWNREIIQTALADFYGNDMDAFGKQLEHNLTKASEGNRKSAPAGTIYLILRPIQAKKHANAITLNSRQRTCYSQGTWSDDVPAWTDCEDLSSCPTKLATTTHSETMDSLVNTFRLWLINSHYQLSDVM